MGVFSERSRAIALAALVFLILDALASILVVAAYGFDIALLTDHGALVDKGPAAAGLLRLGGIVDMVGYLALAPVVIYLHGRLRMALPDYLRRLGLAALVTAGGLGFVLVGAIGAVLLGSVGPWLLEAPADAATHAAARVQFGALENAVIVGLWGTLELPLLSTWLIGVSWIARAEGRVFAWLGAGAGLGALAYGVRTGLTGDLPLPIAGPFDVLIVAGLGLLGIWVLWLPVRLWRGR
ncbi:MAG: hypothetical protein WD830_10400 [Chloroflexota bacterium]